MSTCKTGKICIDSYELANKASGRYSHTGKGSYHAYRCKYCGKWHTGSRIRRVQHDRQQHAMRKIFDEVEA